MQWSWQKIKMHRRGDQAGWTIPLGLDVPARTATTYAQLAIRAWRRGAECPRKWRVLLLKGASGYAKGAHLLDEALGEKDAARWKLALSDVYLHRQGSIDSVEEPKWMEKAAEKVRVRARKRDKESWATWVGTALTKSAGPSHCFTNKQNNPKHSFNSTTDGKISPEALAARANAQWEDTWRSHSKEQTQSSWAAIAMLRERATEMGSAKIQQLLPAITAERVQRTLKGFSKTATCSDWLDIIEFAAQPAFLVKELADILRDSEGINVALAGLGAVGFAPRPKIGRIQAHRDHAELRARPAANRGHGA